MDSTSKLFFRSMHFALIIVGAMWLFPKVIISEFTTYYLPLSIINYALALIGLYYYCLLIFTKTNHVSKKMDHVEQKEDRLKEFISRTVSSRKCPCGHIPKEHNLVHCNVCEGCLEEFDHHCFYLSTCIYKDNIRYFRLFLYSIALMLIYQFILSVTAVIHIKHNYVDTDIRYIDGRYLLAIYMDLDHKLYANLGLIFACISISGMVGGIMSIFAMFHIYLYIKGSSSYSFHKGKEIPSQAKTATPFSSKNKLDPEIKKE